MDEVLESFSDRTLSNLNRFLLIPALVAVVSYLAYAGVTFRLPPVAPKAQSTVMLNIDDKGLCSGVYLGNGLILTAAHCKGDVLEAKTSDGTKALTKLLWANEEHDFMLLSVSFDKEPEAAHLSCRKPVVGEEIHAVGHPLGQQWINTWGHVAGTERKYSGSFPSVPVDLTTLWGMSGGPVFDQYGYVIGLTDAGLLGPVQNSMGMPAVSATGINFMVPSYAACQLLGEGRA